MAEIQIERKRRGNGWRWLVLVLVLALLAVGAWYFLTNRTQTGAANPATETTPPTYTDPTPPAPGEPEYRTPERPSTDEGAVEGAPPVDDRSSSAPSPRQVAA